jgi:UDP-N-acetyl-D-galactosamine dehydrogenase
VDIVRELENFDADVDVYDPWVDAAAASREYGIRLTAKPKKGIYDAVVIAVGHSVFKELGARKIRAFGKKTNLLFDVKYLFAAEQTDQRL